MSKREKLLQKLKSRPRDFTYQEAKTLLNLLGFYEDNKGKTSGSRVSFIHSDKNVEIKIHKPHPSNILKPYQVEIIREGVKRWEELK